MASNIDPTVFGRGSKNVPEKSKEKQRQKLERQAQAYSVLTAGGLLENLKSIIQSRYDACQAQLFDSTLDISTIPLVIAQMKIHKEYLLLFESQEKIGKEAVRILNTQE